MSSTEDAVNRMIANLSKIPTNINSNVRATEENVEVMVQKKLDEQIRELKSRGII